MKYIVSTFLVAILFIVAGCDKSDPLDPLSELYLADFTNAWTEIKGPAIGNVFIMNSTITDSSKGTGVLSADENDGINSFKLKGSFKNLDVKLNYLTKAENGNNDNGPRAGFSYAGRVDTFKTPILIRMANVNDRNDSLVIRHS